MLLSASASSSVLADLTEIPRTLRQLTPFPLGVGLCTDAQPALFPEEEGLLGARTGARRRHDFALGRTAARRAFAELGYPPAPIRRGEQGEPLWPAGLIGSLSHSGSVGLAIVGLSHQHAALGIDLERLTPRLTAAAARRVCTPAEAWWAQQVDEPEATLRRTLIFSAKEAIFKAAFPLCGVRLGFHDAELAWQAGQPTFQATLLVSPAPRLPVGARLPVWAWQAGGRYTLAFTWLPLVL